MKRKGSLLFFSVVLLVMSSASAMATITDTAWTGTGTSIVLDLSILAGEGRIARGYSFGLSSVEGDHYGVLINRTNSLNTFSIFQYHGTYFAKVGNTAAFELGALPTFKFEFHDRTGGEFSTYDLTLICDTKTYDTYTLDSLDTKIKIGLLTSASPVASTSPIPTPGSALLLGSGLLGLLGIGCRRSKGRN